VRDVFLGEGAGGEEGGAEGGGGRRGAVAAVRDPAVAGRAERRHVPARIRGLERCSFAVGDFHGRRRGRVWRWWVGRVRGGADPVQNLGIALLLTWGKFLSVWMWIVDCGVCELGRSILRLLDSGPICAKSSSLEKNTSILLAKNAKRKSDEPFQNIKQFGKKLLVVYVNILCSPKFYGEKKFLIACKRPKMLEHRTLSFLHSGHQKKFSLNFLSEHKINF
jgi:hypothetical protein